ncbi:MAG: hypothetical protein ABJA71_08060 [Ginsengibacter sp.]
MAVSKKPAKKTIAKKSAAKKSTGKKTTKKAAPKKNALKRSAAEPPTPEAPVKTDCMCKQKRPNGNFFCFRLMQGRWVQASGIGFPTKEVCETALCGE